MSSEQEQFRKLRLLLSIKRHEQPPPGYFNRLSADIMAQVRAGQALNQVTFAERLELHAPWLQRFWQALETKPIFAGSFGVAICGLLLAGVAYYSAPDISPEALTTVTQSFVSGTGSEPSVLSATHLPGPLPIYAGAQKALVATGQVISLIPAAVQRHPFAMPVSDR